MYQVMRLLALIIFNLFGRLVIIDRHHLPKSSGYVLACTHGGWAEIVWLGLAVSPRPIHYMAKEELFRNRLLGWFLRKLHAFPVNRSKPGPSSLKIPLSLLSRGEIVGIFPSGTRNQSEIPLKRGAITIAQRAGVPLVPAVYLGSSTLQLKDFLRRKPVTIIFGEPISTVRKLKNKDQESAVLMEVLSSNLYRLRRKAAVRDLNPH